MESGPLPGGAARARRCAPAQVWGEARIWAEVSVWLRGLGLAYLRAVTT